METITTGSWMGHLGRGLAPRELEALLCVAQGMTTKEIARHMSIAPGTAANRIDTVLFKLDARRRADAIAKAIKGQIITPLCIALASLIAMHSIIDEGDPMRRDRRAPAERREFSIRIVRKAEAFEHHA
ncbi:response regulator transcription factor [Pseudomonas sp. Marseille-P9899]|uniref:response regulator transcription factor n=1 Tax=Pseudomonas sp. Marseille-P9899 TaxID=2730401 RepID=UPI00158E518A|nr:helix-turn-helix transcriptional regulator [Pseudomonas sp. Marseille-P9899]